MKIRRRISPPPPSNSPAFPKRTSKINLHNGKLVVSSTSIGRSMQNGVLTVTSLSLLLKLRRSALLLREKQLQNLALIVNMYYRRHCRRIETENMLLAESAGYLHLRLDSSLVDTTSLYPLYQDSSNVWSRQCLCFLCRYIFRTPYRSPHHGGTTEGCFKF